MTHRMPRQLDMRSLWRLAERGELTGTAIQQLYESGQLGPKAKLAAYQLLMLGPSWSSERWPVDPSVRVLPTLTEGTLGLESWVPFGEGWEIPAGFEYGGHGPFEWDMWIQVLDGKAECLAVRTWTPSREARPITAGDFRRLTLGRLVHEAVLVASRPADEIPKRNERWPSVEDARQARMEVSATHKRSKRSPRDRRPITDDVLREVAEVYRANVAGGAPTRAVAEELHYSRPSAGRLVMKARGRGFLPTTERRKARA